MNDPGIFVAGVVVFLIVATAMGFVLWGLRMEARQNRLREERRPNGTSRPREPASAHPSRGSG